MAHIGNCKNRSVGLWGYHGGSLAACGVAGIFFWLARGGGVISVTSPPPPMRWWGRHKMSVGICGVDGVSNVGHDGGSFGSRNFLGNPKK